MYRSMLLGVASSVALVSSAFAADIYTPAAPAYAAVALPPNWGGFYIGANGGYGGNNGLAFREDVFFRTLPSTDFVNPLSVINGSDTIAGGFGGGQLGYNFQFGSVVLGVEGDIQGSGIRGSGARTIFTDLDGFAGGPDRNSFCQATANVPGGVAGGICEGRNTLEVDWFGTVRGRVGWSIGNVLLYGTGGFAAGGVRMTNFYTDNNLVALNNSNAPEFGRVSRSATNTGWTAGGGIEVKLSPSWSLKGEYQFINLGTISAGPGDITIPTATPPLNEPCAPGSNFSSSCLRLTSSKDVDFHTVRVGVNYYFNAPPAPLPLK
jgi:outer membrane immunogenic protein